MVKPCILYISSSIGLGHMSKDIAIAGELRKIRPELDIIWLAGHPASDVISEAGEKVISEAASWIGASKIAETCTHNGQLNLVRYVYRSFPSWISNANLFRKVIRKYNIDLVVGNEAYEIDIPLVMGILHISVPFVMIFDFIGTDPTTDNIVDKIGSCLLNTMWACDSRIYGRGKHSAIFIGEADDIPLKKFAWRKMNRRQYALKFYNIVGNVIRFNPLDYDDCLTMRHKLGYGDKPLIVCSAGGTSIGKELLELCGQTFSPLREYLPDAQMIIVLGPRISKDKVQLPEQIKVFVHYPKLYELFAACDVAVVQCGASSTTELAALRTPFIYFPIEKHFEQELVASRLARYKAGKRMSLKACTPDLLAEAIFKLYRHQVTFETMPVNGAKKAAFHILKRLDKKADGKLIHI